MLSDQEIFDRFHMMKEIEGLREELSAANEKIKALESIFPNPAIEKEKVERFYYQSDYDGGERCVAICGTCSPDPALEKEREIPEEIMKWIWASSAAHSKGMDSEYREQAEEDFSCGAKSMYHKSQEAIQIYVDVADDQQVFIDKLQHKLSGAEQSLTNTINQNLALLEERDRYGVAWDKREKEMEELRAKIKELQEWHDSHL